MKKWLLSTLLAVSGVATAGIAPSPANEQGICFANELKGNEITVGACKEGDILILLVVQPQFVCDYSKSIFWDSYNKATSCSYVGYIRKPKR